MGTYYTTNEAHIHSYGTFVKTDKNGSRHYIDHKCPKCHGTGYLQCYGYIQGGVCFKCSGTGKGAELTILQTEEYAQKLADRRKAKKQAEAPRVNREWLQANNFNRFGKTWVYLGNTFVIKDELKACGARFCHQIGWHSPTKICDYSVIELDVEQLTDKNDFGWITGYSYAGQDLVLAEQKKFEAANAPITNYFGEVGKRYTLTLTKDNSFIVSGYYGDTAINKFHDAEGNTFIWKTGSTVCENNQTITLTGTVKEHGEYKGTKQTVLTRCKVKDEAQTA